MVVIPPTKPNSAWRNCMSSRRRHPEPGILGYSGLVLSATQPNTIRQAERTCDSELSVCEHPVWTADSVSWRWWTRTRYGHGPDCSRSRRCRTRKLSSAADLSTASISRGVCVDDAVAGGGVWRWQYKTVYSVRSRSQHAVLSAAWESSSNVKTVVVLKLNTSEFHGSGVSEWTGQEGSIGRLK